MNLHLMVDDKFLDPFIEMVEQISAPGTNTYICYARADPECFKWIKSPQVIFISPDQSGRQELLARMTGAKRVFVHWLSPQIAPLLTSLPPSVRLFWCFWGGDYYQHPVRLNGAQLYEPETLSILDRLPHALRWNWSSVAKLGPRQAWRGWQADRRMLDLMTRATRRVDYFCHWNRADYDLVRSKLGLHAQFLDFIYPLMLTTENYATAALPEKLAERIRGRHVIQLGHSADPANNHASVLRRLAKLSISREIIVLAPLSYADVPGYADGIQQFGEDLLGDRFLALREMLSRDVYTALLDRVDTAIMNHRRTQAGFNVFMLLMLGKKLFLNQASTLYEMLHAQLKSVGCTAELSADSLRSGLNQHDAELQTDYIRANFDRPAAQRKIAALLEAG